MPPYIYINIYTKVLLFCAELHEWDKKRNSLQDLERL